MSKTKLMMLLVVVCNSAMAAQWQMVTSNKSNTIYIDPASITKKGTLVNAMNLYDFKIVDNTRTFNSLIASIDYDCKEKRTRMLSVVTYSENMGRGNILTQELEPKDWTPVQPGGLGEVAQKNACENQSAGDDPKVLGGGYRP